MEFCVISPIAGLERYSTLSRVHLLLPQIDSEQYWKFYEERSRLGDFIILDNGAYEGQADWKLLVDRITSSHPDVCVLPDYYCQDWQKTYREAMRFLDSYYYEFPGTRWMYVPQAEPRDIVGWVNSLYAALEDERIRWIGLPRMMGYSLTQDRLIRAKSAIFIKRRWPNIKLHALGMMKGDVGELNALRDTGCVTSIDSNAPVWRGWCGYDLNEEWPEFNCDYTCKEESIPREWNTKHLVSGHEMILRNLEVCGVNTSVRTGSNKTRQALVGGENSRLPSSI